MRRRREARRLRQQRLRDDHGAADESRAVSAPPARPRSGRADWVAPTLRGFTRRGAAPSATTTGRRTGSANATDGALDRPPAHNCIGKSSGCADGAAADSSDAASNSVESWATGPAVDVDRLRQRREARRRRLDGINISTYLNISQHISTYLKISQNISKYLKISQVCSWTRGLEQLSRTRRHHRVRRAADTSTWVAPVGPGQRCRRSAPA
eukprot:SAG31_NODE_8838_length_1377_cov_1.471049_2_plen_211_part_00